jgi:hypothetical protein
MRSSSITWTVPFGVVFGTPSGEAVATHAILFFTNSCTSLGIPAICRPFVKINTVCEKLNTVKRSVHVKQRAFGLPPQFALSGRFRV